MWEHRLDLIHIIYFICNMRFHIHSLSIHPLCATSCLICSLLDLMIFLCQPIHVYSVYVQWSLVITHTVVYSKQGQYHIYVFTVMYLMSYNYSNLKIVYYKNVITQTGLQIKFCLNTKVFQPKTRVTSSSIDVRVQKHISGR